MLLAPPGGPAVRRRLFGGGFSAFACGGRGCL